MNSKRKPRGGASRVGPSSARSNNTKTPERDTRSEGNQGPPPSHAKEDCEGVYRNARFTHTVTSLIGNTLRVETQNNIEFEGILKTFSPQLEMVLEWVHEIDPGMPDCINHETVKEKMVFPMKDIVRYYVIDVDLNFATKEEFQTDTQISNKFNGETPMRELEQWMPDGSEDNMVDLESGGSNSNGWSAHEMFAKNKEFGVETSYDPNMSGYTTQLSRNSADSAEYRERERKAALIAAEIEGSTNSIAAVELENGDEEEAFSAVVRDKNSPGDKQGAYIPPGRRDQGVPRGSGGRGRGVRTTPPAQNDYDRRYDRSYSGNRGGYNNDRGGDRYDRDRGGYNNDYRDRGYNNRDNRDNRGHDNRDRGGYKKTEEKKASPLPEHEKQVTGDARRKSGENRSPEQENNSHRLGKKSREQQQNELKEFHDTFKLESVPRVSVKGQGGSQHSTPLPSPQPAETAPAAPAAQLSPAAPADLAPAVSPAAAAAPDSVKKSTLNPLAKEFSLNPSAKEFTPRGPSSGPVSRVNPTPPRPQTPNTPNSNNMAAMAQAQGIPQAFSQGYLTIGPAGPMSHMNVNNGMFVPAQPHPHMIQAAGGQPMPASIAGGQPGGQPQVYRPGPGQQRGQGGGKDVNNGGQGRPDLPSPLQVTGHPILAGGAMPGHQPQFMAAGYPGGPQPQLYPGQPHQGPPQVVRMIMPGGVPGGMIAPGLMPVMSQADNGPVNSGQNMWSGGQTSQHPPPTPPQPNTPAPSPGLPQMYNGGHAGHHQGPPQYQPAAGGHGGPGGHNLIVMTGGPGQVFPGVPTSAPPHPHMLTPGAGHQQPVTSMSGIQMHPQPQYFIPQHQGGAHIPAHMMASAGSQPPINQQ